MQTFDWNETAMRFLKYLFEGLVVATVAMLLPGKKIRLEEAGVIGLSAAAGFAILDLFSPSIGVSMRQGAGFGMGAQLVGFPASGPQMMK